MKTVIAVMVLTASALAQGPSVRVASACGIKGVTFDVKLGTPRHPRMQPESGKAMVYSFQDDGPYGNHQHYVLKIALDGTWVGAYKKNSYFTVPVMPGEHHVCANLQSNSSVEGLVALAHFTAEPGKVYYFRTRLLDEQQRVLYPDPPILDIDSLDSDEAKYLITYYPVSVSYAKK